jgi:hypothetical protein
MALFLVYGKDNVSVDPLKDARACYKLGDIVEVLDDSSHNGNIVNNPVRPPFYLVRITGVTKSQALKYMEPYFDPVDANGVMVGGILRRPTLRRRLYNVEIENIPLAVRNTLKANRYIELLWSQVRNYVRNRMTGTTVGATP